MSLVSPVLLAEFSLSGFFSERILPWWESFARVFVGEDLVIQLSVVLGAFAIALVLSAGMRPLFRRITEAIEQRDDWIEEIVDWVSDNLFRLLLVGILWSVSIWFDARNHDLAIHPQPVAEVSTGRVQAGEKGVFLTQTENPSVILEVSEKNYILIRAFASIATLWLLSGALPNSLKKQAYYKLLFFILASGLAMNLLGIWDAIREGLDRIHILPVSGGTETDVTVLTLVKGVVAILVLIPLAGWVMRSSEKKVSGLDNVSPALQVLSIKLMKAVVVTGAVMFSISAVGINLSSFAVLGGAIGLGLGFGFQKVVSNLISGVILLSDRSIKPGDVIEVGETYGWINKLSARYVSVITRDGMEHLIPNETLITEKVTNWSFSDDMVRVRVPFGVSYNSDIHKVMELAIEAGRGSPRVIPEKEPVCWLLGFGDSSVDFELRVWIRDPANGLNNLRSGIYVELWDAFKEHGIEIPFPQRDLNIRGGSAIEVVLKKQKEQLESGDA